MNPKNQNSESSPTPDVNTIRAAQKMLAQGDLSGAFGLYRSVLEQVGRYTNSECLLRIDAYVGLIIRSAIMKEPDSVLQGVQKLKTEIELLKNVQKKLWGKIALRINATTETLGSLRSWTAVKRMSRLVFQVVTDEVPNSLAHRIRALNNLGSALVAERRFDDASHIWKCAINDHGEQGKRDCPAPLATIHNNLAELLRLQGRFEFSELNHGQALELRLNCFEQDHILVRQSRINLAQVLSDSFKFAEALEQVQAYLDSFSPDADQQSPEYLRAQTIKARLLMELGRYLSAEKLVNQLARSLPSAGLGVSRLDVDVHLTRLELAIRLNKSKIIQSESTRLPQVLEQAKLLNTVYEARLCLLLGRIACDVGSEVELRQAEELFQKAAKIFRTRLSKSHPLIAQSIFQLAESFTKSKRQKRGSQTANTGLEMMEQVFGEPSIPLIAGLLEMSRVVLLQGHFKSARKLLKLATSNFKANSTASAVFVLRYYDQLRQTYVGLSKPRVAAYFARQAWNTISNEMEVPASQKAIVVDQALKLSMEAGHSRDAIVLQQRKIELLSEEFHFAHPSVTEATEQLGRLYAKLGEPDHAADQLAKISTVRCSFLGEESDQAMELMELTAKMHRDCGQTEKAEQDR